MSDTKTRIRILILYFICDISEETRNTLKQGERLSIYREGIYVHFVAVDGIRNQKPTKKEGQTLINDKTNKIGPVFCPYTGCYYTTKKRSIIFEHIRKWHYHAFPIMSRHQCYQFKTKKGKIIHFDGKMLFIFLLYILFLQMIYNIQTTFLTTINT